MESIESSSVSPNGVCIAAASNHNSDSSANTIPHYLLPSAGSCHDICKYGRRRASGDEPPKPMQKRASKLSVIVPTHRKKEVANHEPSADCAKPSSDAKTLSPRPKIHSPRVVKRGTVLPRKPKLIGKESNSVSSKMSSQDKRPRVQSKPVVVEPSSAPFDSSSGVRRKRRRNDEAESGRNTASSTSSSKKTWMPAGAPRETASVELLSPRKDLKRVKRGTQSNALDSGNEVDNRIAHGEVEKHVEESQIQNLRTDMESSAFEFEFEFVTHAPPSSSHGEDDEESDKLSDTTLSERKMNRIKRRRKSGVVKSGDEQSVPIKLKFRMGNSINVNKGNNVPIRHKLRTRGDGMRKDSSISDNNKSVRIGAPKVSRSKDRYCSSKDRRGRIRYVKTRILVLEDKKGDLKRNFEENNGAGAGAKLLVRRKSNLKHQYMRRKKDVKYLFDYVIEETVSKLAERRKGMVKSLVGAFEKLISLQVPQCFMGVRS